MARNPLTAASMTDMILDRLAELDRAIAMSTEPAELVRLMSQRADGIDMLTALTRRT